MVRALRIKDFPDYYITDTGVVYSRKEIVMDKKTFDVTYFFVELLELVIGLAILSVVAYLIACAYWGLCMGLEAMGV